LPFIAVNRQTLALAGGARPFYKQATPLGFHRRARRQSAHRRSSKLRGRTEVLL